jgi:hypothetical protein
MVFSASAHPMSVINGSFESYAWAQAVLIHNMTPILGHPLHYSPFRLAHGSHPVFASIPFGAKVYVHLPKDSRLAARNRGDDPAARSEPGVAIGPRSQQDPLPLILTSRNTTKASRTTRLEPRISPRPTVLMVSSTSCQCHLRCPYPQPRILMQPLLPSLSRRAITSA